jgi:hypothetical protein
MHRGGVGNKGERESSKNVAGEKGIVPAEEKAVLALVCHFAAGREASLPVVFSARRDYREESTFRVNR